MFNPTEPRRSGREENLEKKTFFERFKQNFTDPNFDPLLNEINQLAELAWQNYQEGRKAPVTHKAGDEFANPDYELSLEWLAARAAIQAAEEIHQNPSGKNRILLINGSDRNENTCPGEISKSFRLIKLAREIFESSPQTEVEILDLSKITSEYGKMIYPCKGCVSTSMPLCHWPCSCYPNHSLNQVNDWMNEIYPMWVRAHGIMLITPVYWHQAPSALKLMIDRLVCADGGNTDPTTTHGKNVIEAKTLELKGWPYPRHLAGRIFSVIVHGDAAGVDHLKSALTNWLEEMELIPVSTMGTLARYIGYLEPYATSHEALDRDFNLHEEVQNAARSLALAVASSRRHFLDALNPPLVGPRPK